MEIEGLSKQKVTVDFWARAEQLGIDTAGLTGPLVKIEVEKAEAILAKKPAATEKKDAKPAATEKKPVALMDLDVAHLKRIAKFLEVQVEDARKKESICDALSRSDAWTKADQAKVVEATAAG